MARDDVKAIVLTGEASSVSLLLLDSGTGMTSGPAADFIKPLLLFDLCS
jgi:hypothetical protein